MKLIPPDRERCQAEITTGNFMTIGGRREERRCENRPEILVEEKERGPDGKKGSMSLCRSCAIEARKVLAKTATFTIMANWRKTVAK